MTRCPITYERISEGRYSIKGLRQLSSKLSQLRDLPYTSEELYTEYVNRAGKMSIQGVQPKLSMKLNISEQSFEIVDIGGKYIAKPQNRNYPELPENEDLTMKMAGITEIETPWHGLIYTGNNELCYIIKRFDRTGHKNRLPLEDFAQLTQVLRKTKYDSSMEKVISIVDNFVTFPIIEKIKMFRIILFNYLVGNEDMHLKNFSLLTKKGKVELSPAYDLLNTSIAIANPVEEIALPIAGKKSKLKRADIIDYLAKKRMNLPQKSIDDILYRFESCIPKWEDLIAVSFLTREMKEKYFDLLHNRLKIIFC